MIIWCMRLVPLAWGLFSVVITLLAPAVVQAQGGNFGARAAGERSVSLALVVRNDRGGLVSARVAEVAALRASGRAVEIRGQVCLSSCTLYLALPKTCVDARTTFGFHGPTHYGQKLSARDFEYWSQVIAAHYPAPLAKWYLKKGRSKVGGYYRIKGAELIRLGLRDCATVG
ncbi:hypothetical protein [Phaeovulum sp.]|uniref:hypothetical protein n=1 Tax=Phaeovulum sp. TaxID=2934796 RepID=UPI0039E36F4A